VDDFLEEENRHSNKLKAFRAGHAGKEMPESAGEVCPSA
jgi:hypothetical protein